MLLIMDHTVQFCTWCGRLSSLKGLDVCVCTKPPMKLEDGQYLLPGSFFLCENFELVRLFDLREYKTVK